MFCALSLVIPLFVMGSWSLPMENLNSTTSSEVSKIHIVIEVRTPSNSTSANQQIRVFQAIETSEESSAETTEAEELTTPTLVKTSTTTTPTTTTAPTTTTTKSTTAKASTTAASHESSEELLQENYSNYLESNDRQFESRRPVAMSMPKTDAKPVPSGAPTKVDFLKRDLSLPAFVPSKENTIRLVRRTAVGITKGPAPAAVADAESSFDSGFEVVGTFKEATL